MLEVDFLFLIETKDMFGNSNLSVPYQRKESEKKLILPSEKIDYTKGNKLLHLASKIFVPFIHHHQHKALALSSLQPVWYYRLILHQSHPCRHRPRTIKSICTTTSTSFGVADTGLKLPQPLLL